MTPRKTYLHTRNGTGPSISLHTEDRKRNWRVWIELLLVLLGFSVSACSGGQTQVEFGIKHLRDQTGEQIAEIVSYETEPGLDNSSGSMPLQVQIQFERNYRHQIIERLQTNEISNQRVRDKIVELYKLPVNDPEGTIQKALCPISIIIPAGQKARITIEWTERWAEGVINRGAQADGDRMGNYTVFLGYIEPCSLVAGENIFVSAAQPPVVVTLPLTPTSPIVQSYPITPTTVPAVIPPAAPADVVEIESPRELYVTQSDIVRITLKRTNLVSYTTTIEVAGNDVMTDVVLPIVTPQASLEKAYGDNYQLFATAKLASPDFDIQAVSPESQIYDADTITWLFSISGKKAGKHRLSATLTIRWLPMQPSPTVLMVEDVKNSIERQVWRGQFDITVTEPLLRVGSYTIGDLWTFVGGGGLAGAILGWFANDIKDKLSSNSPNRKKRAK